MAQTATKNIARSIPVLLILTTTLNADVRFVDDDAPPGGNGLNWQSAYRHLQDALAESRTDSAIDEIRVAAGTYTPDMDEGGQVIDADTSAFFLVDRPIALRGGFGGLMFASAEDQNHQNPELFETILSGDLSGDDAPVFVNRTDNSSHVVVIDTNDDSNWMVIEGLTIRGGEVTDFSNGAGLDLRSGALRLRQLLILENRAYEGGGLDAKSNTRLELLGSRVLGNRATRSGGGLRTQDALGVLIDDCLLAENSVKISGGGLSLNLEDDSIAVIRQSTFRENISANYTQSGNVVFGGAIAYGGGDAALLTVDQCQFISNEGGSIGGAIYADSDIDIFNSRFIENSTPGFGPSMISFSGGAIGLRGGADATIMNCELVGNQGGCGSAIGQFGAGSGSISILNSTIVDNRELPSPQFGSSTICMDALGLVKNCIINGNETPPFDAGNNSAVSFSNVEGGWIGAGNIDADPMFIDRLGPDGFPGTGDEDLRLGVLSPCIDAGSNGALPADAADLDDDSDITEPTPLDLNLEARRTDVPGVIDTGVGTPPIVDMGAYEFQTESDGDGDGEITAGDYALFNQCLTGPQLAGATQCPSQCCDWFDADHDADVDMMDFHALLLQLE